MEGLEQLPNKLISFREQHGLEVIRQCGYITHGEDNIPIWRIVLNQCLSADPIKEETKGLIFSYYYARIR